jgi:hypothetical protein
MVIFSRHRPMVLKQILNANKIDSGANEAHIHRDDIPNTTFSNSGVPKTCISARISKYTFSRSQDFLMLRI